MGIRTRTALYVALTMIVLTVVMIVVAQRAIDATFAKLETDDAVNKVDLAVTQVNEQALPLSAIANSYAGRRSTYRFVSHPYAAYAADTLADEEMARQHIDFVVFLNGFDEDVFHKVIDPGTLRTKAMPTGLSNYIALWAHQVRFYDIGAVVKPGLVGLSEGPAAVGAAPVYANGHAGTPDGWVLVGRFLTSSDEARIAKNLGFSVVWFSTSMSPGLPPEFSSAVDKVNHSGQVQVLRHGDNVAGYGLVSASDGRPAVILRVSLPRTIVSQGQALRDWVIGGMVLFIVVSILALGIVLNTTVLSRLAQLSARVAHIGSSSESEARMPVKGRDEIARLATGINKMLDALHHSKEQLLEMATHDSLTHVFNRRRFEEELTRELAEADRLGRTGALLWFDLDKFKEINDEYGHAAGDAVLVEFAEALSEESRKYSSLARFGGDEFVMVIPGADEAEALRAADRLLEMFRTRIFTVAGHSIRIATSIGIAHFPGDGATVDDLLAHADAALYEAKKTGRGRACSFASALET